MKAFLIAVVVCLGALTGAAGESPQGTAPSYVIDGVVHFRGADGIYRATSPAVTHANSIVAQLSAPVPMEAPKAGTRPLYTPLFAPVPAPATPVFPTPVRTGFYQMLNAPLNGCANGQCPTPGRR